MENIAFTTLVVLLLAVPGYFVRAVYFTEDFSRDVVSKSLTEEIYLAVLYSIPFHVMAIWAIDYFYINSRTNTYVDFEMALSFLTGRFGKEGEGTALLAENLYQYFNAIVLYFSGLTVIAMVVGFALRSVVWRFKLDVRAPTFFRFRNRWLYTFTGRDRESQEKLFGVVDAMCLLGGEKTRLYRGLIVGFESNADGDLEQIQLGFAYRGKFQETKNEFYWQEVPGSILVLKYNTIQSLNITYIPESSFNANSPSFLNPDPPDQQIPAPVNESSAVPASPAPAPSSQPVGFSRKPPE